MLWFADYKHCYMKPCITLSCHAMPCCTELCCSIVCYAMLCYAMPCYAMPCYAMLCHAMLCYANLCHAMPGQPALLCHAMLCDTTLAASAVVQCAMLFENMSTLCSCCAVPIKSSFAMLCSIKSVHAVVMQPSQVSPMLCSCRALCTVVCHTTHPGLAHSSAALQCKLVSWCWTCCCPCCAAVQTGQPAI